MLRTLSLSLFLLLTCACGTPGFGGARRSLLVASDLEHPPFIGTDETGQPIGRDIEMMERAAALAGYRVVWKRMDFDELLPAAERGEVDVVCATLGVTEARKQRVLFSDAYFKTRVVAVARTGPDEPRTAADLTGKRVYAGLGTTAEDAVRRHLPDAIGVFENKSGLPTAERVLNGEVDAALMDGPDAVPLLQAARGKLRILAIDFGAEDYALVFPPNRHDLRDELDAALDAMNRSGEQHSLDVIYGLVE